MSKGLEPCTTGPTLLVRKKYKIRGHNCCHSHTILFPISISSTASLLQHQGAFLVQSLDRYYIFEIAWGIWNEVCLPACSSMSLSEPNCSGFWLSHVAARQKVLSLDRAHCSQFERLTKHISNGTKLEQANKRSTTIIQGLAIQLTCFLQKEG